MKNYRVRSSGPLRGRIRVPGDKSIGHRSLIFSALAEGRSVIRGLSGGLDNQATQAAFRQMGVAMHEEGGALLVEGVGLRGLRAPAGAIDCGNSGTTMRLMTGLLAAQPFSCELYGDESLSGRPMGRVAAPLKARGARIEGRSGKKVGDIYPPLQIRGVVEGDALLGLEYEMPVASAQVKSALLLSGLYASGPTRLREPVLSRDHTERMMKALGVPLEIVGSAVSFDPADPRWKGGWEGVEWLVPGDPSSAAFPIAAALMMPESELSVEGCGVNPTRMGFFDALRVMGAELEIEPRGTGAGDEPIAEITAHHASLRATFLGGELLVRMIDEVPVMAALAAMVPAVTEIRDAEELRVKESDRIEAMVEVLRAFGADVEELADGMTIHGGAPLHGARVVSRGDHRIAMSAVLLGLVATGETVVEDVGCIETSFPGFADLFRSVGADIREEEA